MLELGSGRAEWVLMGERRERTSRDGHKGLRSGVTEKVQQKQDMDEPARTKFMTLQANF